MRDIILKKEKEDMLGDIWFRCRDAPPYQERR